MTDEWTGKGSWQRIGDRKKFNEGWDRIFKDAIRERVKQENDQKEHQDRDEGRETPEPSGSHSA
jgi:hypothetical protein